MPILRICFLFLLAQAAWACTSVLIILDVNAVTVTSAVQGKTLIITIPMHTTSYSGSNGNGPVTLTATSTGPFQVQSVTTDALYGQSMPGTITITGLPTTAGVETGTINFLNFCGTFQSQFPFSTPYNIAAAPGSGGSSVPTFENTLGAAEAGEPISTKTGEVFQRQVPDLDLGGPLPLRFVRHYASLLAPNSITSALGANWMHNFEAKLSISGANATVTLFRGQTVAFKQSGSAWQLANQERFNYQLVSSGTDFKFLDVPAGLIYTFSSGGALTRIEDRNGNALSVTQSASGPAQVSDGLGRTLAFTYANGKLTRVQDQSGRSVSFSFSGETLSSATDANGKVTSYAYTSAGTNTGLLTAATLPLANKPVTHAFDSSGRATRETDSAGNSMNLAFDTPSPGTTSITDARGGVTKHTYGSANGLGTYTDPLSQTATIAYDSAGRRISLTDRLGDKSALTYDASGFVASGTDALGNTVAYSYTAQTQGGLAYANLTAIRYADGSNATLAYDGSGNLARLTNRGGGLWNFTYNARGQILTAANPSGGMIAYTYNSDGTLASQKLNSGDVTTFAYDDKKRLSKVSNPDNTSRQYTYDNAGHLLQITDEAGNVVKPVFNDNGNPRSVTDPLNNTTTFLYDGNDRLNGVTNPLGKSTTAKFNELGLLSQIAGPTGIALNLGYNAQSLLTSVTGANGKGVTIAYDKEGIPAAVTDVNSNTWKYASDKLGRITSVTNPAGAAKSVAFDKVGRVSSRTDALGRTTAYTYDSRGLPLAATAPGGVSVALERNGLGEVTKVTDAAGNIWRGAYDAQGRLMSASDPAGNVTTYSYDNRQRVTGVTVSSPPATNSQRPPRADGPVIGTFAYNPQGQITQRTSSTGTQNNYKYDSGGNLTNSEGLALGFNGNSKIVNSNGITNTFNDAGGIQSTTAGSFTFRYDYDANGNLLRVSDSANATTNFTRDNAAHATQIDFPNRTTNKYAYDGLGRASRMDATVQGGPLISDAVVLDPAGQIMKRDFTAPLIPSPANGFAPYPRQGTQLTIDTYDSSNNDLGNSLQSYEYDGLGRLLKVNGPAAGPFVLGYDGLDRLISIQNGQASMDLVRNYALPGAPVQLLRMNGADQAAFVYSPDGTLLYGRDAKSGQIMVPVFNLTGDTVAVTGTDGTVFESWAYMPDGSGVTNSLASGATPWPLFTFGGQQGVIQLGNTSLFNPPSGPWFNADTQSSLNGIGRQIPNVIDFNQEGLPDFAPGIRASAPKLLLVDPAREPGDFTNNFPVALIDERESYGKNTTSLENGVSGPGLVSGRFRTYSALGVGVGGANYVLAVNDFNADGSPDLVVSGTRIVVLDGGGGALDGGDTFVASATGNFGPASTFVPDVFHLSINGNIWVDSNRSSVLNHNPIVNVGRPDLRPPAPASANRIIVTPGEQATIPVTGLDAFEHGLHFNLVPTPTGEQSPAINVVDLERAGLPPGGADVFRISINPADLNTSGPGARLPLTGRDFFTLVVQPNRPPL